MSHPTADPMATPETSNKLEETKPEENKPEENKPEGNGPEGNGPEGNGPEGNGPEGKPRRWMAAVGGLAVVGALTVGVMTFRETKTREYTVDAATQAQQKARETELAQQIEKLDSLYQETQSPRSGPTPFSPSADGGKPPETGGVKTPFQANPRPFDPGFQSEVSPNASPVTAPPEPAEPPRQSDPYLTQMPGEREAPPPMTGQTGQTPPSAPSPRPAYRGKTISLREGLEKTTPKPQAPVAPPARPALPPPPPVENRVVESRASRKPPFGAYLQVRLLGAFSVQIEQPGQSYLRFETVRDMAGPNWRVPRGAQWIGQADLPQSRRQVAPGAALQPPSRLPVKFIGYIDPVEQKLVPVSGEVYGEDGDAGLKTRRKRVDPRWQYALARIFGIGLDTLYQRLAAPFWVLPNVGDVNILFPAPIAGNGGGWNGGGWNGGGNQLPPLQPQYVLQAEANQTAYILVTELPPTIDGSEIIRIERALDQAQAFSSGAWPGPNGGGPGWYPAQGGGFTAPNPAPGQGPGRITPGMSRQQEYQELLQLLQSLPSQP